MNTVKVSVSRLIQNAYPFLGKIVFDLIGDRNTIPVVGIFCKGSAIVSLVPNEQISPSSYYKYQIFAQGHIPGIYLSDPVEEGICVVPASDCNLDSIITDIPDQASAEQIIADASSKISLIQNTVEQTSIYAQQAKTAANSALEANQNVSALVHQAEVLRQELHTGHIPSKVSQLENDAGYLTEHQSLTNYALKSEIPTSISAFSNDTGYLTSLSWEDLQDKPESFSPSTHTHAVFQITDFPENISVFNNDSGYITEQQAILNYAPKDVATTSSNGLMSSADKTKLDNLSDYPRIKKIGHANYNTVYDMNYPVPEDNNFITLKTDMPTEILFESYRGIKLKSNYGTQSGSNQRASISIGVVAEDFIGEGLTATNGIISVPVYTGANTSYNGVNGLVPAATIAEKNYYLKGDGTWGDIPVLTGDSNISILVSNTEVDPSSQTFEDLNDNALIIEIEE